MIQTAHFYQTIHNQELRLQLPIEFAGQEVEIVVMIVRKPVAVPEPQSRVRRFRGILKSRRSRSEIDLFIEKMRDEWENNI